MRSKRNRGKGLQLKKYNLGGVVNATDPIKKPAKRVGSRINPDGTESTHLYATETLDGKNWVSFPMLFQNADGSWVDMSSGPWEDAYEEAKKRGEVIDFGQNKQEALDWGMGSWKVNPYKIDQPTAIMDNTYIPTAAEQQFMNLAPLLPKGDPDPYRDQGTIRPQQPNEPTYLQKLWEGTPLGQTEEEKYASPDQMSMVDVMAEPLKALAYYSFDSNRGNIPTRAEWDAFDNSNAIDMATSIVNPFWYMSEMSKGGSEGLAGITGIGKIGQVVRDAFNTGDDVLRIAAENVSKQGQKMTQRQLAQQINKSPAVDLEESVFNPSIYGVENPGFGTHNRSIYESSHPFQGSLMYSVQDLHFNDYGLSAIRKVELDPYKAVRGYSGDLLDQRGFNYNANYHDLPFTTQIVQRLDGTSEAQAYVSSSIPQIRPMQRGGDLEKFIDKSGNVNLGELTRYIRSSNNITPADRFILEMGIDALPQRYKDGEDTLPFNLFKQQVSEFVPRMNIRESSTYADILLDNIIPNPATQIEDHTTVIIGESDLPMSDENSLASAPTNMPTSLESSGNYMLNLKEQKYNKHFDLPKDPDGNTIGYHSHYRVYQLKGEPEVSYFPEIQSDGLQPGGGSEYNLKMNAVKNEEKAIKKGVVLSNPLGWEKDTETNTWHTGSPLFASPVEFVTSVLDISRESDQFRSYLTKAAVENPGVAGAQGLNLDFDQRSLKQIESWFDSLNPDDFREVYDKTIRPAIIKDLSTFLSGDELLGGGLPSLYDRASSLYERMEKLSEMFGPNLTQQEIQQLHKEIAFNGDPRGLAKFQQSEYREIGDEVVDIVEGVTRASQFVSSVEYEVRDIVRVAGKVEDSFIRAFEYRPKPGFENSFRQADQNEILISSIGDVLLPQGTISRINQIVKEIRSLESSLNRDLDSLEVLKKRIGAVRSSFNVFTEEAFPKLDTENPEGYGLLRTTEEFEILKNDIEDARFLINDIAGGRYNFENGTQDATSSFTGIMKLMGSTTEISNRMNVLIEEYNSEVQKIVSGYMPDHSHLYKNPVSQVMRKRPERRIINEALHGPHNNLYNRFPTEETSRKIQGHDQQSEKYDAVQRKYRDMEKTLKAMGYEPKLVTDKYGNTWWEVKATTGMLHGTAEYDAYWKGGRIGLKKKRSGKMRSVKC